jgi:ATP-binding cassette, subfamily B, multidrug efflux pump
MNMFGWFERLLDSFPADDPETPPKTLVAFCMHYTKGAWGVISIMAVLTALIAVIEVSLFGFLGNIVDWLTQRKPETFFQEEGTKLLWIGAVALILMPVVALLQSLFIHQSLLGNYPMRIRWQVHRYLLKQSMAFYQDEFAGRIATKLMQTALAVRETVLKVLDVLNYVIVYFIGVLVLMSALSWKLTVPMLVWLVVYISMLRYFIPRLKVISERQADARSMMTGRIVDSYTTARCGW